MSLGALDKYLMKLVLAGEKGAPEAREYMKAKARSDIIRNIATANTDLAGYAKKVGHRSDWPAGITGKNQLAMEAADDARKAAVEAARENPVDPRLVPEIWDEWEKQTLGPRWGK